MAFVVEPSYRVMMRHVLPFLLVVLATSISFAQRITIERLRTVATDTPNLVITCSQDGSRYVQAQTGYSALVIYDMASGTAIDTMPIPAGRIARTYGYVGNRLFACALPLDDDQDSTYLLEDVMLYADYDETAWHVWPVRFIFEAETHGGNRRQKWHLGISTFPDCPLLINRVARNIYDGVGINASYEVDLYDIPAGISRLKNMETPHYRVAGNQLLSYSPPNPYRSTMWTMITRPANDLMDSPHEYNAFERSKLMDPETGNAVEYLYSDLLPTGFTNMVVMRKRYLFDFYDESLTSPPGLVGLIEANWVLPGTFINRKPLQGGSSELGIYDAVRGTYQPFDTIVVNTQTEYSIHAQSYKNGITLVQYPGGWRFYRHTVDGEQEFGARILNLPDTISVNQPLHLSARWMLPFHVNSFEWKFRNERYKHYMPQRDFSFTEPGMYPMSLRLQNERTGEEYFLYDTLHVVRPEGPLLYFHTYSPARPGRAIRHLSVIGLDTLLITNEDESTIIEFIANTPQLIRTGVPTVHPSGQHFPTFANASGDFCLQAIARPITFDSVMEFAGYRFSIAEQGAQPWDMELGASTRITDLASTRTSAIASYSDKAGQWLLLSEAYRTDTSWYHQVANWIDADQSRPVHPLVIHHDPTNPGNRIVGIDATWGGIAVVTHSQGIDLYSPADSMPTGHIDIGTPKATFTHAIMLDSSTVVTNLGTYMNTGGSWSRTYDFPEGIQRIVRLKEKDIVMTLNRNATHSAGSVMNARTGSVVRTLGPGYEIPSAAVYDAQRNAVFVGDTNGNITIYTVEAVSGISAEGGSGHDFGLSPLQTFPNPADDELHTGLMEASHVIYDITGAMVATGTTSEGIIDVRGLASGWYRVVMQSGRHAYQGTFIRR